MSDSLSATPQCSQTRPALSNRMISMSCTSTRVSADGTPMNSPLCVPVTFPRHGLALARDQVLDVHAHIRKRSQQDPKELQRPLLRGKKTRPALVLDEVVRHQVDEPGDVSRVDPLVGIFPHRRTAVPQSPSFVCGCSMGYCMRAIVLAAGGEDIT